ncbi:MAG: dTMP kinase [Spirochaetaceae bacterium]|jgi:dTMP kinase|nr:dTMP kinase [Spirochaetaceae bacterium]
MVLENFAVLEGIDGAGTTTQINLLKEKAGERAVFTAEPSGSPVGVFLRQVLRGAHALAPGTLAYLFAADRFEHVWGRGGVAESLRGGKAVVSDRYFFSSLAYQSPQCGGDLPRALNRDFPLPRYLVYLAVDVDLALERIGGRGEKEIFEKREILVEAAAEYEKILSGFEGGSSGMGVIRLDGSLPREEIHQKIWAVLRTMPILSL